MLELAQRRECSLWTRFMGKQIFSASKSLYKIASPLADANITTYSYPKQVSHIEKKSPIWLAWNARFHNRLAAPCKSLAPPGNKRPLICRKTSSTNWWEWLEHPPVPATWHNSMPRSILSHYFQGCVKTPTTGVDIDRTARHARADRRRTLCWSYAHPNSFRRFFGQLFLQNCYPCRLLQRVAAAVVVMQRVERSRRSWFATAKIDMTPFSWVCLPVFSSWKCPACFIHFSCAAFHLSSSIFVVFCFEWLASRLACQRILRCVIFLDLSKAISSHQTEFSNIIINIAPKHTNSPRPFVILWIKRTRHDSLDKEDKKKEKEEDQAERARFGSDYCMTVLFD